MYLHSTFIIKDINICSNYEFAWLQKAFEKTLSMIKLSHPLSTTTFLADFLQMEVRRSAERSGSFVNVGETFIHFYQQPQCPGPAVKAP